MKEEKEDDGKFHNCSPCLQYLGLKFDYKMKGDNKKKTSREVESRIRKLVFFSKFIHFFSGTMDLFAIYYLN